MKTNTSIHAEAGLHRKLVLLAQQLELYLGHFPNCHKYTLTQQIRLAYLDVYNLVTEAQKRYHKKTTLTQLDVRHEQLRMLVNLAHELGLFDFSAGRRDTDAPTGIPIGNLMSQTFANLYLNSLDQFCKRALGAKDYGRYMDDSIMLAPDRATGLRWLGRIRQHLALLGLEISHYSLQPIKRGANFVGFRTWARARFVRPHVISQFRRDARRGHLPGVISRLGHARRSCSLNPLLTHLKDHHGDIYRALPQGIRRLHHIPAGRARHAGRRAARDRAVHAG